MTGRPRVRMHLGLAVLVTALVALLVRFLVASPYRVDTAAMEPAARQGDIVLGQRHGSVERGDVVVFTVPTSWLAGREGRSTGVSRVVGQPGDEVRCCDAQGRLVVNGLALAAASEPTPVPFRVVVGHGHLFLRGDNPAGSVDSRCYLRSLGPAALVPVDAVRARLQTVVWPMGHLGGLKGKPQLTTAPPGQEPPATSLVEAAYDVAC